MKKTIATVALLGLISFSACVPAKKYNDLKTDYQDLKQENSRLSSAVEDAELKADQLAEAMDKLASEKTQWAAEKRELTQRKAQLQKQYENLKDSYDALEAHSSSALSENAQQNRKLLAEIEEKREQLQKEKTQLQKLKSSLQARGKRIETLESAIAAKEQKMQTLKENISAALADFEGKGLTVHRKNGRVYVSMENKLLFNTASYAVNSQGQKAVHQLGEVLAKNADIHVMIEGHTDNVPYTGTGIIKDNWDLSVKRATSIVRILLDNNGINPKRITAAGRSKYVPVADNSTATGRAKNRRIEVILTPEWSKLTALLNKE